MVRAHSPFDEGVARTFPFSVLRRQTTCPLVHALQWMTRERTAPSFSHSAAYLIVHGLVDRLKGRGKIGLIHATNQQRNFPRPPDSVRNLQRPTQPEDGPAPSSAPPHQAWALCCFGFSERVPCSCKASDLPLSNQWSRALLNGRFHKTRTRDQIDGHQQIATIPVAPFMSLISGVLRPHPGRRWSVERVQIDHPWPAQ
ncbi:hypothetical protein VTK26DRAFT_7930 [Humicola hyalothermophila]